MSTESTRILEQGVMHHQSGRLDEALQCYLGIAASDPNWPHARHYLGLIAFHQGRYGDSVALIGEAIAQAPGIPEFHVNLGNALKRSGELPAAIAAYDRAIRLRPGFAAAHGNRGLALQDLGLHDQAIDALGQALALDARLTFCHFPLARSWCAKGDFRRAQPHFALGLAGETDPEPWVEAGKSALATRHARQALDYCAGALRFDNDHYDALNGMGTALAMLGRASEAIAAYKRARAVDPTRPEAIENLATALKNVARIDDALESYRVALSLAPDDLKLRSNYLLAMMYSDTLDAAVIAAEHRRWDEICVAQRCSDTPFAAAARNSARLRVGYVSGDWHQHPVAIFMEGVLRHHDRQRFEIVVYHTARHNDDMTRRLRGVTEHWRDVPELDDRALMSLIRQDAIDVLVDLAGHTADNSLGVFSTRAAPVQISYLGYPHASGVAAIDYRISDNFADPPELRRDEALLRLPRCYYGYSPPQGTPAITSRPPLSQRSLRFGVAANLAKVSPSALDAWSQLLAAFPQASLRWLASPFADTAVRQRMQDELAARGIIGSRLQLEPWAAPSARWKAISQVDIGLDTQPFNLATNLCESLWMGVPTLSLAGISHASRHGGSVLVAAGLRDCVGSSVEDWIARVEGWLEKPAEFSALRKEMRHRLAASELCDCAGLARALEAAYLDAAAAAGIAGVGRA